MAARGLGRRPVPREAKGLSDHPRFLVAGNGGPFTLDGTRTYLVGRRRVAVIDAGPEGDEHVTAVAEAVGDADEVSVVVTHGHRDHAPAAFALAERLGVEVWGPEGLETVDRHLSHGDALDTDQGELVAIATPGHARHHVALHWPARRALFAGDLLLGRGATTWVGEYAGCVADYLASLERIRALALDVIYPAHGPPLEDPAEALARYESHRLERIRQVEEALARRPDVEERELVELVYGGSIASGLEEAALRSVRALMDHVVRRPDGG
jgi:glyoxylase-like metal-dependent hydrolase (beta-lactamase superfamily II)